jgi:hypothetical protein
VSATKTDFNQGGTTFAGSVAASCVTGTSIGGTVSESGNSNSGNNRQPGDHDHHGLETMTKPLAFNPV